MIPPGEVPAAISALGVGRITCGALANHWKRWDAKPEAEALVGPPIGVTLVRLQFGKPSETMGRQSKGPTV